MPSPLKRVWEKIFAVSAVSSRLMAAVSDLPRSRRICLAEASSCLPSGVSSLMADKAREEEPRTSSAGLFSMAPAHFTAAIISGTRMRPSLSVSINSSVRLSNSRPRAGQLKATQSF